MKSEFAKNTTVSVEKSQQEVMAILRRYGADRFGTMEDRAAAYLMFEFKGLQVQMTVPMPGEDEFKSTPTGRSRASSQRDEARAQEVRRRWRCLVLGVKAKLECVESGISTVEKEFLAFVVMPDGKPLSDHLLPQLKQIAASGRMPRLSLIGGL